MIINDLKSTEFCFKIFQNSQKKMCSLIYRKVLPPQTGELNIHFGVFFGGLGDFSESYLNSVDNFRGCMSDVRMINMFV